MNEKENEFLNSFGIISHVKFEKLVRVYRDILMKNIRIIAKNVIGTLIAIKALVQL